MYRPINQSIHGALSGTRIYAGPVKNESQYKMMARSRWETGMSRGKVRNIGRVGNRYIRVTSCPSWARGEMFSRMRDTHG